jgi:MFS family permease
VRDAASGSHPAPFDLALETPMSKAETPTSPPPRALAAFAIPNFRRFVTGQSISLVGSWTETVAQALLILQLTDSGLILGLATAARYLPVLVLTPYAGLIIDRSDKHRVLIWAAVGLAVLSAAMGTLVATHMVQVWIVFIVATAFGCLSAFDNPARQAFIPEIVGVDLIHSAVTLNSTFVNVGRAVGPIVAATLITTVGVAWCFYLNAGSFVIVLVALLSLRTSALRPAPRTIPARGQLIAGFRYARTEPLILAPLVMMAIIGTLTYEFEVSLPLFASGVLGDVDSSYPWLIGAFGLGSVLGGVYCTLRPETGLRRLIRASVAYAVGMAAFALASTLWIAVAIMVFVGIASITFLTTGNSTIQIASAPQFRGRVTALWSTAFLGTTPLGSAVIGAVGGLNPRLAFALGAGACVVATLIGLRLRPINLREASSRRVRRRRRNRSGVAS